MTLEDNVQSNEETRVLVKCPGICIGGNKTEILVVKQHMYMMPKSESKKEYCCNCFALLDYYTRKGTK